MTLFQNTLATLKHPFFLLVVGSIIGSFLIPRISEETGKKRALQQARLQKAVEIVETNNKSVSQLNSLLTRAKTFDENNPRMQPSADKLRELQEKLVEDMDNRWLEWEKTGWGWYRTLNDQAVILEIVPPTGSDKLREDVNRYGANMLSTTNAIKAFWHACTATNYNYKDKKVAEIGAEVEKTLAQLFTERNQIVNDLVSDFTEPH